MATFTDDFIRANAATLGANWTTFVSSHELESNQAKAPTGGGSSRFNVWATDCATDDNYSAAILVQPFTGATVAVVARVTDVNNFYRLLYSHTTTTLTLSKTVAGSVTTLGTQSVSLAFEQQLLIECRGTNIRGYVDGSLYINSTDSSLTTGKKVGIRSLVSGASPIYYNYWEGGDLPVTTTAATGTSGVGADAQSAASRRASITVRGAVGLDAASFAARKAATSASSDVGVDALASSNRLGPASGNSAVGADATASASRTTGVSGSPAVGVTEAAALARQASITASSGAGVDAVSLIAVPSAAVGSSQLGADARAIVSRSSLPVTALESFGIDARSASGVPPDETIADIVIELLDCIADRLYETEYGIPGRVCMVPGQVAWDGCECGQLTASLVKRSPSDRFPDSTLSYTPCGHPLQVWVVTFTILRCVPTGANDEPPTCEELQASAIEQVSDASVVETGLACCLNAMTVRDSSGNRSVSQYALGDQVFVGPQGSCGGSTITVYIGLLTKCGC